MLAFHNTVIPTQHVPAHRLPWLDGNRGGVPCWVGTLLLLLCPGSDGDVALGHGGRDEPEEEETAQERARHTRFADF